MCVIELVNAHCKKVLHAQNVKLTLSELMRLFNDPVFNNRVATKLTDSGFMVTATLNGETQTVSIHWPHEGKSFNRKFLNKL